jgi:hypothetical protein
VVDCVKCNLDELEKLEELAVDSVSYFPDRVRSNGFLGSIGLKAMKPVVNDRVAMTADDSE